MKKLFGALLAGGLLFGAVFASASQLPLFAGTGSIQSSTLASVTCQSAQVHVTYTTQLNGQGVNEIKTVTLSPIDSGCWGDQAEISMFQADPSAGSLGSPGHLVWYGWDTIPLNATSITLNMATHNPALPPVLDVQYFSVMFSAQ
jgi:hypothetical protein